MNPRTLLAATLASALAVAAPSLLAASADGKQPRPTQQFDKNGDGQISRDEAQAAPRLATSFDRIDTNKDGQLSREELRAARPQKGDGHRARLDADKDGQISRDEAKTSQRLSQDFDKLDTNKDGQLSREELNAARRSGSMARLDVNQDGVISREEAKATPRLASNFDAIDANKDGELSREELAAWRQSRTRHAQSAPTAPAPR